MYPPSDINRAAPLIMHIDLNSAFATAEQQAHPSLRGQPIGVTNRISTHCCVIAASYEAKAQGVRVGMRLSEARQLAPGFIILESDPAKYHHIYTKLLAIMRDYSPAVTMKSIDEGVIDFKGTDVHNGHRSLCDIGYEIKQRVRAEIGSWMRINVGIGPNHFLAKQAASWHKPDGLDVLDYHNLRPYYRHITLTDLSGIAQHYEARLKAAGIYTPLAFLDAPMAVLRRQVFQSVVGEDWYKRLRGYEVDDQPTKLGSIGRQFVLDVRSMDEAPLLARFQYLCETTARKLRYRSVNARGVLVWVQLQSGESWYVRKMHKASFCSNYDVYQRALYLFGQRPRTSPVAVMGITCYQLEPSSKHQPSLFEADNKQVWLSAAIDEVNERYGMFTLGSAPAISAQDKVQQKIPFGGTEYFRLLLGGQATDQAMDHR